MQAGATKGVWKKLPVLSAFVTSLVLIEVVYVLVLPLFVSDNWYLQRYLPERSIASIAEFFAGERNSLPDYYAGWRNRPNNINRHWVTDRFGSRSAHAISEESQRPLRSLFIGSSMINGGMHVDNQHTLSAYTERASQHVEAINFGTMLYSLDQAVLAYEHSYSNMPHQFVVVGVDARPTRGLRNIFIPFRERDETNLPFIKPRFNFSAEGELQVLQLSSDVLKEPFDEAAWQFLRQHDQYYAAFDWYKHTGFTPLAAGVRMAAEKLSNLNNRLAMDEEEMRLLLAILKRLENLAQEHGAQMIVVSFPNWVQYNPYGYHRLLPDLYQQRLELIENEGFNVLNGRRALKEQKLKAKQVFAIDKIHLSAQGNKVLGDQLAEMMQHAM